MEWPVIVAAALVAAGAISIAAWLRSDGRAERQRERYLLGLAPEIEMFEAAARQLEQVRSPSGTRFFPGRRDRDELVATLVDVHETFGRQARA
jgi:hypothetical protein